MEMVLFNFTSICLAAWLFRKDFGKFNRKKVKAAL
jgi:hypothetical protein